MNYTNKIAIKFLLCVLGFFIIKVVPISGYSQEKMNKETIEFAQISLGNYIKNVVNETNFGKFGFKNVKTAQTARLGDPFAVMIIGLEDLKNYRPESGAKSVLKDASTLWFPVLVEGKATTKLEIMKKNGKLISGEFGRVKIVREIEKVQEQLPELLKSREIKESYEIKLVKIPALAALFFYLESTKGEFLIPAFEQPSLYKLENARIYEADEVLVILKDYAQKIDKDKLM